ncbi:MAG: hypothetical protein J5824_06245 [Lachnospiraceae bacterium]|nr:hypothetical protein [Lachnospiraceae bacterium]
MKKKFEAEYLAFTGRWHVLIMLGLLAAACVIAFFLSALIWQVGIMIAPILSMGMLCFMDYFTFSGTNSKKSKGMEVLRSSPRGGEVLYTALKQDVINKSLFNLLVTVFIVTVIIIDRSVSGITEFEDSNLFIIAYGIAAFATGQVLIRLTLLLTRSKGLTMQVHMLIVYLIFFAGTLIMIPLIFLTETHSLPIMCAYAAVMEIFSVLTGKWLISSCRKAYEAQFYDETIM